MNQFYDNHANDIEYFNIPAKAKSEQKPVSKKKIIKVEDLTDDELFDKHIEVTTSFHEMTELYQKTQSQNVLTRLEKLNTFKTVVRIAMRKRKIETYSQMNLKLGVAEKKAKEVSSSSVDIKTISNLKGEAAKYKKLYQDQKDQNMEIKETEKTKRHELSTTRDFLIFKEFKNLVNKEFGEYEYSRLISKACETVDSQTGVENERIN